MPRNRRLPDRVLQGHDIGYGGCGCQGPLVERAEVPRIALFKSQGNPIVKQWGLRYDSARSIQKKSHGARRIDEKIACELRP